LNSEHMNIIVEILFKEHLIFSLNLG
jgi:hypothetical protein